MNKPFKTCVKVCINMLMHTANMQRTPRTLMLQGYQELLICKYICIYIYIYIYICMYVYTHYIYIHTHT